MFESVDKKLEKIGFMKLHGNQEESKHGVCYRRKMEKYGYYQRLDIRHKVNGRHLIMSYQEDINKEKFNNSCGLTYEEMNLAMKKYRQMKRKYKWQ